jgi:hypothetical protein
MTAAPKFSLHWVNIVILAEFHNPSILNPDFLKGNKIVPQDWEAVEVLTTPAFASVKYSNNVVFFVDRERFEVRRECGGEFLKNYDIHDMAATYVNVLPHVRYTTMGLNWQISIENAEPEKFVTERFLKAEAWKDSGLALLNSSVNLNFEIDSVVCKLNFMAGRAKVADQEHPAVIISINFHHKGPFTIEELTNILKLWKIREDYTKELLPKLLGESS